MIEHMMGTLLGNQRSAFVASAGTNDRESRRARELHASKTDASRSAMYENRFSRLSFPALEQTPISRGIRHTQSRALRERSPGRKRMHPRFFAKGEFSIRARDRTTGVNAVSRFE